MYHTMVPGNWGRTLARRRSIGPLEYSTCCIARRLRCRAASWRLLTLASMSSIIASGGCVKSRGAADVPLGLAAVGGGDQVCRCWLDRSCIVLEPTGVARRAVGKGRGSTTTIQPAAGGAVLAGAPAARGAVGLAGGETGRGGVGGAPRKLRHVSHSCWKPQLSLS